MLKYGLETKTFGIGLDLLAATFWFLTFRRM